jgi:Leucine-rich repeat (LRR) protein
MSAVPDELRELGVKDMKIEKLDLSERKLTQLPESIGKLRNLTDLILRDNKLKTLPKSFENLTKLVGINAKNNAFQEIPKSLFKLKNLQVVSLTGNQIKTVPDAIGGLTKLLHLGLNHNKIERLNPIIGNLKKLGELRLGRNKLKTLPSSIGNLTKLDTLSLIKNDLSSLPDLSRLRKLEQLDIRRNPKLTQISSDLRRVPKLLKNAYTGFDIKYTSQELPKNGVSNSVSYINFSKNNTAIKIKNGGRASTYMTANTFKRLANASTMQAKKHIYRRRSDVKTISDVYNLNKNTDVLVNPMTTKMVKRSDMEFVKFK